MACTAWLSETELAEFVGRTRRAGGTFGVAGQLRLGELRRVDADVVGVRSAVCRGGDRTAGWTRSWSRPPSPSSGLWRWSYVFVSSIAKVRRLTQRDPGSEAVRGSNHDRYAGPTDGLGEVRVHDGAAAPSL